MHLKHLTLRNFKNHAELVLDFVKGVNCITGANGSGKTNILDALHFLSFTKSFLIHQDQQLVRQGTDAMLMDGVYDHNGFEQTVQVILKHPGRKTFKVNNNAVGRLGSHIGMLPLVLIAPQDIWLLQEGSSERRRFMDMALCQLDKQYLSNLNLYNKALEQRNRLLKQMAEANNHDAEQLESLDKVLIPAGEFIYEKRAAFIKEFVPFVIESYKTISRGTEDAGIIYSSGLQQNKFATLLNKSLPKDLILQRTSAGIHKDDLEFSLHNFPVKTHASQGQQKTFILALKMAVCYYIYSHTNIYPILLLDDIFEKLDNNRSMAFLQMAANNYPGQVIITDTHVERCKTALKQCKKEVQYINLNTNA
ncbi:MAG: DNA replication/repair protein RecF [Bacteroidota bacterium]|nr:DNA replication/repair protein RecF [Bacteroidota bacterium]